MYGYTVTLLGSTIIMHTDNSPGIGLVNDSQRDTATPARLCQLSKKSGARDRVQPPSSDDVCHKYCNLIG